MGGAAEQTIEKPAAKGASKSSGSSSPGTVGAFRIHKNHGEVHIHDDKDNLKFVMDEAEMHDVYWPEFLARRAELKAGDKVALIGKVDGKAGGGRKNAILVCEKKRTGGFDYYLEEYNDNAVYDFEVGKDAFVETLNEWVSQNL